MKTTIKRQSILASKAQMLVVPVCELDKKTPASRKAWSGFTPDAVKKLSSIDKHFDGALSEAVARFKFKPKAAKRIALSLRDGTKPLYLRLSGLSKKALDQDCPALDEWRRLGGDAFRAAESAKVKTIALDLSDAPRKALHLIASAAAEGALLAEYKFTKYKTKASSASFKVRELSLLLDGSPSVRVVEAVDLAAFRAQAAASARDLVNTPALDMTPRDFLKAAKKVCQRRGSRLQIQTHTEAQLKRMGAHSLLSVARGSSQPPYLIHISYKPRVQVRGRKKVALVGKGVTFDSGGLSIKPWDGMTSMKCDMAGAAAVLGTMSELANLGITHEVHGIIPLVENMINGEASRPGDVVRAINGKSIEILNTDAEGRLILADALCYSKKLRADLTIDLATLTGACVVALGQDIAAVYSDDDGVASSLLESSRRTGDKLWRMPLEAGYRKLLDSKIADMQNIGGRTAGSITAALFLKEFVPEGTKWAHLDIAGPAFMNKASEYTTPGATGFGVRLLLDFLEEGL